MPGSWIFPAFCARDHYINSSYNIFRFGITRPLRQNSETTNGYLSEYSDSIHVWIFTSIISAISRFVPSVLKKSPNIKYVTTTALINCFKASREYLEHLFFAPTIQKKRILFLSAIGMRFLTASSAELNSRYLPRDSLHQRLQQ